LVVRALSCAAICCAYSIEEYAVVLARSKFAFPPDEIAAVLTMFRSQGELFRPDVSAAVSSDPAATKFLHWAEAAQADYIVTGNKRDFPAASYGVTRVVSAGALLDRITFEIWPQPTPLVDMPAATGGRALIGRKVDSSTRRRLIG
jgi:hypothetical protein